MMNLYERLITQKKGGAVSQVSLTDSFTVVPRCIGQH